MINGKLFCKSGPICDRFTDATVTYLFVVVDLRAVVETSLILDDDVQCLTADCERVQFRWSHPVHHSNCVLHAHQSHRRCCHSNRNCLLTSTMTIFNGLFFRTTRVSWYHEGKTSLDLNEARDDGVWGWQWHQLDHMQTICSSLQTDNHTNTSSLNFYRLDALPDAQPTAYPANSYMLQSQTSASAMSWWVSLVSLVTCSSVKSVLPLVCHLKYMPCLHSLCITSYELT